MSKVVISTLELKQVMEAIGKKSWTGRARRKLRDRLRAAKSKQS